MGANNFFFIEPKLYHKMLVYINDNQSYRRKKVIETLCAIVTEPVDILFRCISDVHAFIVEPLSTFSITLYPIDFIMLSVSFPCTLTQEK